MVQVFGGFKLISGHLNLTHTVSSYLFKSYFSTIILPTHILCVALMIPE